MKKTIKRLTAYILAVLLLPCVTVSADSVGSIRWETQEGTVALASSPDGQLPLINPALANSVEVTFAEGDADQATLMIVPTGEEPTSDNAVLVLQSPVTEGKASFDFYLKPTTAMDTYAVYASGANTVYAVRYLEVGAVVSWHTELGAAVLADSAEGRRSAITSSLLNNVEVAFPGGADGLASLMITPTGEEPTTENAVLVLQAPITEGKASFSFYLKPTTENGVYALRTGATGRGYITKYIEINDNVAPKIVSGQILQYDDYKNSIKLKLSADTQTGFEEWTAEDMTVTLSSGEKSVEVLREHIRFDAEDRIMEIATTGYEEIFPESPTEGNIQQTEISIVTPGYWGDSEFGGAVKGSFGMVIPEVSAEGFAVGVPFEITVYADNEVTGANAIVALYDDNLLVDFKKDIVNIAAGETKTIPLEMKSENLSESGKFSLKVMLWDEAATSPLTSFVVFP